MQSDSQLRLMTLPAGPGGSRLTNALRCAVMQLQRDLNEKQLQEREAAHTVKTLYKQVMALQSAFASLADAILEDIASKEAMRDVMLDERATWREDHARLEAALRDQQLETHNRLLATAREIAAIQAKQRDLELQVEAVKNHADVITGELGKGVAETADSLQGMLGYLKTREAAEEQSLISLRANLDQVSWQVQHGLEARDADVATLRKAVQGVQGELKETEAMVDNELVPSLRAAEDQLHAVSLQQGKMTLALEEVTRLGVEDSKTLQRQVQGLDSKVMAIRRVLADHNHAIIQSANHFSSLLNVEPPAGIVMLSPGVLSSVLAAGA